MARVWFVIFLFLIPLLAHAESHLEDVIHLVDEALTVLDQTVHSKNQTKEKAWFIWDDPSTWLDSSPRYLFEWKNIFSSNPESANITEKQLGGESTGFEYLICLPHWIPHSLLTMLEGQLRSHRKVCGDGISPVTFRPHTSVQREAKWYLRVTDKVKNSRLSVNEKMGLLKAFNLLFLFLQTRDPTVIEATRGHEGSEECPVFVCNPQWYPPWLLNKAQKKCRDNIKACGHIYGNVLVDFEQVSKDSWVGSFLTDVVSSYDKIVEEIKGHPSLLEHVNNLYTFSVRIRLGTLHEILENPKTLKQGACIPAWLNIGDASQKCISKEVEEEPLAPVFSKVRHAINDSDISEEKKAVLNELLLMVFNKVAQE